MTLAMMLLLVKRIPEVVERLRGGGWRSYDVLGRELSSMTVGLVGLGNVGLAVARMLRALGARVVAFDPGVSREEAAAHGVEWFAARRRARPLRARVAALRAQRRDACDDRERGFRRDARGGVSRQHRARRPRRHTGAPRRARERAGRRGGRRRVSKSSRCRPATRSSATRASSRPRMCRRSRTRRSIERRARSGGHRQCPLRSARRAHG